MVTETKQKGWVALNEDGTKVLSVHLGGLGYPNTYSLTTDVNKVYLCNYKNWVEGHAAAYNRSHKNQVNFQFHYVERTLTAMLRYEKEPGENS